MPLQALKWVIIYDLYVLDECEASVLRTCERVPGKEEYRWCPLWDVTDAAWNAYICSSRAASGSGTCNDGLLSGRHWSFIIRIRIIGASTTGGSENLR